MITTCTGLNKRIILAHVPSHFTYVWFFVTLWTVALQSPLSMGFSRKEYWRGLPCPPPGDLPVPGIQPSCITRGFFITEPLRKPLKLPSVQFSSVAQSDSLPPHGLQHASLPFPSSTSRACSDSCPSSQWCHPTNSSSIIPFSYRLQSFPESGLFKWVSSLHQVAKVLELQHQFLQRIFTHSSPF